MKSLVISISILVKLIRQFNTTQIFKERVPSFSWDNLPLHLKFKYFLIYDDLNEFYLFNPKCSFTYGYVRTRLLGLVPRYNLSFGHFSNIFSLTLSWGIFVFCHN